VFDFDWLFEGWPAIYALLIIVVIALGYIYWQTRHRGWLYGMLGVFVLIGVYALLDRLVETDRELLERKIKTMAADLQGHNLNAFFDNLDDNFHSFGKDKDGLRAFANGKIIEVSDVRVRNFDFQTRPERGKEFTGLRFMFKINGVGVDERPFDCEPVFEFDRDKGWRVMRFDIFPFGSKDKLSIQL
jgi:hypothetical protein